MQQPELTLRRADSGNLDSVEQIITAARDYLRAQGSPQWQNGFGPSRETLTRNLAAGEGYVLLCDGVLCGYGTLVPGEDAAYTGITDGQWAAGYDRYVAIHSVALHPSVRGRGLSALLLRALIDTAHRQGFRDVRIDTHRQNTIMQRTIAQVGFVYRGRVHFPIPDGERMAYQLLLD